MNSERFNGLNAAMLLIDHQIGTMNWVRSAPLEEIKKNTVVLAKAARALNMPVILTSSMEEHVQGPGGLCKHQRIFFDLLEGSGANPTHSANLVVDEQHRGVRPSKSLGIHQISFPARFDYPEKISHLTD